MSELNDRLAARLAREWQQRGPLAWALTPFACLFGAIAAARRAAFSFGWLKSVRVGVPVVVVGNVTVGGTGKTPTVIALVEALAGRRLYARRGVAWLRRARHAADACHAEVTRERRRRRTAADRAPHAARRCGSARIASRRRRRCAPRIAKSM